MLKLSAITYVVVGRYMRWHMDRQKLAAFAVRCCLHIENFHNTSITGEKTLFPMAANYTW